MVTKEAAMSFSQFGYPYNATSQVSHFASFYFLTLTLLFTYPRTHIHARTNFIKDFLAHRLRIVYSQTFSDGLTLLTACCVWCFCCETKYRYTRTRVQLHWIMNELTCFFSDDNRDECHIGVIWLLRCARWEDTSPDFTLEPPGYDFSRNFDTSWSSAQL